MQDSKDPGQTEYYEEELFLYSENYSLKLLYRSLPWQTHRCSNINNGCISFRCTNVMWEFYFERIFGLQDFIHTPTVLSII